MRAGKAVSDVPAEPRLTDLSPLHVGSNNIFNHAMAENAHHDPQHIPIVRPGSPVRTSQSRDSLFDSSVLIESPSVAFDVHLAFGTRIQPLWWWTLIDRKAWEDKDWLDPTTIQDP